MEISQKAAQMLFQYSKIEKEQVKCNAFKVNADSVGIK